MPGQLNGKTLAVAVRAVEKKGGGGGGGRKRKCLDMSQLSSM